MPDSDSNTKEAPAVSCLHAFLAYMIAMLVTFILLLSFAVSLTDGKWIETDASVMATSIESTRPGKPQWSLMVDFEYTANGLPYRKSKVAVLHRDQREDTRQKQKAWPPGKTFPVFYAKQRPGDFSLTEDGGREVSIVVAVIMTPMMAIVVLLPYLIFQNNRRRWFAGAGKEAGG